MSPGEITALAFVRSRGNEGADAEAVGEHMRIENRQAQKYLSALQLDHCELEAFSRPSSKGPPRKVYRVRT